jgi:hypothetical protein
VEVGAARLGERDQEVMQGKVAGRRCGDARRTGPQGACGGEARLGEKVRVRDAGEVANAGRAGRTGRQNGGLHVEVKKLKG